MKIRLIAATIVLAWFTAGPGLAVGEAQCRENADCGAQQYCQKSTGDCDGVGTCATMPTICPDVWDPVCGCDGSTFGNACEAAAAGINVAFEGECLDPPCQNNGDCSQGEFCQKTDGDCDGDGTCAAMPTMCLYVWDPVCGCDGSTYANECSASMAGVSVESQGECPPPPCQDNDDCAQGEFCQKSDGECDGQGLCADEPPACFDVWDPVCGCDGSTYANECEAAVSWTSVAYEGECLVACSSHQDCSLSEYCDTAHNGCFGAGACRERPTQCTQEYDPVCGCNELTYGNPCEAATLGLTVAKPGDCGQCPFDPSADCIFSDALETGGTSRWSRVVGD